MNDKKINDMYVWVCIDNRLTLNPCVLYYLLNKGYSASRISHILGCGRTTVYKNLKKYDIDLTV